MHQSTEQTKSTDKHSSHESQDRKRQRPSLFPLRNSAKRKSSLGDNSLFNPHGQLLEQKQIFNENQQVHTNDSRDDKSETQFHYKTPSVHSDYSSPKTARLTPKQFIFDTPFVPFVHQSFTKTVWQSQQIIPQQRDDIERKQSQTQHIRNNLISEKPQQQVKQEKNSQSACEYISNNKNSKSQSQGSDTLIQLNPNQPHQYRDEYNKTRYQVVAIKQQYQNLQNCESKNILATQLAVSINIPSSKQQNLQTNNQIKQHENPINANNLLGQQYKDVDQDNKDEQIILKQQTSVEQTNNNFHYQNFSANQYDHNIEHNVFVSKAPIYYERQQQTLRQKFQSVPCEHVQVKQDEMYCKNKRKNFFGFSYIEIVSIKPHKKVTEEYAQQSSQKTLNKHPINSIKIPVPQKNEQFAQIQRVKLQINNAHNNQIKSTIRSDRHTQVSYQQKLHLINQCYQEKIGFQRQFQSRQQQTQIDKKSCANQTQFQNKKTFKISEQVNFSISNNLSQQVNEKLNKIQNYIKDFFQSKDLQIQNIKNRRSVDRQINTENYYQNSALKSQNKQPYSSKKKSVRSFGCQYEIKDAGIRPSLKRVSIADTKIIYDVIDQSNSTETFDQKQQKKQQKRQVNNKSKKNDLKISLKQEKEQDQQEQQEPAKPENQNKKSKRKSSKTPRKKKSKH